jgi:hypothetical protein
MNGSSDPIAITTVSPGVFAGLRWSIAGALTWPSDFGANGLRRLADPRLVFVSSY